MILRTHKSIGLFKSMRFILTMGALVLSSVAISQTDTITISKSDVITGIVRDAITKEPVSAAQINTVFHRAAATTDDKGQFEIKITSKNDVLLIKAIDYNTIEVAIAGKTNVEVELYKDVYSNYYPEYENATGKKRSSAMTNASNTIVKSEDPSLVTVDNILHSSMGGALRASSRSGEYGIGSSLFIRGLNSINLNSQPLFVVDGVIWNDYSHIASVSDGFYLNPLADIDPNDIESITVVKNGTSLYGSKGANGVVLIKTKRGVDMATKINLNITTGINQKPKNFPLLNGEQFRLYTTDLLNSEGLSPTTIDGFDFLNNDPSSSIYKKYHNATNWEDEIYQAGIFQSYNISVNGGDEKALYSLSIGYTGNRGNLLTTNMQRINTRFNADLILAKYMDLGLNVGFTNVDKTLLDDGVNFHTSPSYLAMIKPGFLSPYLFTSDGTLTSDFEDADDFNVGNPLAVIENSLNSNKHYRLNFGLKPVFKISKSLSISNKFDYSLFKAKESHYNPVMGTATIEIPGLGLSENFIQNQVIRNNTFYNDMRVMYNYRFNNDHDIKAFAGFRYISDSYDSDYIEGHNTGSDEKRDLKRELFFKYLSGVEKDINTLSYYINADYSYDNRYFLTAAVSIDGSSHFGRETEGGFQMFDHSWAVFPSVNAAWLTSSESFMADIPYVDYLKVRAGFGLSGNDGYDQYAYSAFFSPINYMDRANGMYISNIGNSQIQWETTAKLNFGFDANAFNNLLALSLDLYSNTTNNLIHMSTLPEIVGEGTYWTNGGSLSNKGFEFSAKGKAYNSNTIQVEVGASIGHYKNKIEELPGGEIINSIYDAEILTAVGNAAGVFYGYETDGVFKTQTEADAANLKIVDANGNESYFGAGDMHFVDDGDGIIDENDKKIIGDPNPDIYGSFNGKVTYGDFTFEALFTYSYGNDIYNYLRYNLESGDSYMNQSTAMLNRWTYDGQQTDMPTATFGDPMGNSRFSDRWIEDGSYLRFKSLSVNYKLPFAVPYMEQVKVWASANNLFTLSNYLGRDPEVYSGNSVLYQGIDSGLIPVTRGFLIGVKANL